MRYSMLLLVPAAIALTQPAYPRPQAVVIDPVIRWNHAALASIRAEKTPPPIAARNLAIVHVAMYDAAVAADGGYDPFYFNARAVAETNSSAAAVVAAHRALIELYPNRIEEFDSILDDTINQVPEGPAKERGIALGQKVAERVIQWRVGDLKPVRSNYTPREEPGRWRPTMPKYAAPLLPAWGSVPCFAVADGTAFRPVGPPALDSEAYAANLRTLTAIGSTTSTTRTKEQTQIAHFWADGEGTETPPGHWNQIAQSVASKRKLSVVETARLFAMLNVTMADAGMICWDCKFRFDVWRPVTAIRVTDPNWTPLLPTPPFPAYTSGHSSFSGSAAAALAAYFGTDDVKFTSNSDGLPGVTRSFNSFSAAANEAGMSRIYGGIHWEFDNTDGLAGGRKIGEHITSKFFQPTAVVRKREDIPTGNLRSYR